MKLLLENWRECLNEVTTISRELKQELKNTIIDSAFWTYPHTVEEVDEVGENELGTPAIKVLMDALNNVVENLGTDLHFLLTVNGTGEYTLGPKDQYGGYPNNWIMRGQYRGPEEDKHIIWLEFRPISEDYNIDDLDPAKLAGTISRTINHELVHYKQLKKQAGSKGLSDEEAWEELTRDPLQISTDGDRSSYLSLHNEIDAFAYQAAEQLLDRYSADEAFQLIKTRDSELSGVVRDYLNVLGDNPTDLKKFWSKLYTQIERQYETPT